MAALHNRASDLSPILRAVVYNTRERRTGVADDNYKAELYRRLKKARRMSAEQLNPLTKERLLTLVSDLEDQIAAVYAVHREALHE